MVTDTEKVHVKKKQEQLSFDDHDCCTWVFGLHLQRESLRFSDKGWVICIVVFKEKQVGSNRANWKRNRKLVWNCCSNLVLGHWQPRVGQGQWKERVSVRQDVKNCLRGLSHYSEHERKTEDFEHTVLCEDSVHTWNT